MILAVSTLGLAWQLFNRRDDLIKFLVHVVIILDEDASIWSDVRCCELPVDSLGAIIPVFFPNGHFSRIVSMSGIRRSSTSLQYTELTLRYIQPTAMLGRVIYVKSFILPSDSAEPSAKALSLQRSVDTCYCP